MAQQHLNYWWPTSTKTIGGPTTPKLLVAQQHQNYWWPNNTKTIGGPTTPKLLVAQQHQNYWWPNNTKTIGGPTTPKLLVALQHPTLLVVHQHQSYWWPNNTKTIGGPSTPKLLVARQHQNYWWPVNTKTIGGPSTPKLLHLIMSSNDYAVVTSNNDDLISDVADSGVVRDIGRAASFAGIAGKFMSYHRSSPTLSVRLGASYVCTQCVLVRAQCTRQPTAVVKSVTPS
ncbi:unnamed protein product, partial [Brenthis ino]